MAAFTTWIASAKAYFSTRAGHHTQLLPADRPPTYATPASLAAQSVTDTELQVVTVGQSAIPSSSYYCNGVGTIAVTVTSEEEVAPKPMATVLPAWCGKGKGSRKGHAVRPFSRASGFPWCVYLQ